MLPWPLRKKPRGHTRSKKPTSKGEPAGPQGLFPSYPTRIGRGARGHAEAMRLLQMTTVAVRYVIMIGEERWRKLIVLILTRPQAACFQPWLPDSVWAASPPLPDGDSVLLLHLLLLDQLLHLALLLGLSPLV